MAPSARPCPSCRAPMQAQRLPGAYHEVEVDFGKSRDLSQVILFVFSSLIFFGITELLENSLFSQLDPIEPPALKAHIEFECASPELPC